MLPCSGISHPERDKVWHALGHQAYPEFTTFSQESGNLVSDEKGQEKGGGASLESVKQAAGLTDEDALPA